MAKRSKKAVDVQKFGGVEDVGNVQAPSQLHGETKDFSHDLRSIEVQSQTHLEDDQGHGGAAVIRTFEFGINREAFMQYQPTTQELFNSHYKGIELALWKDGLKVMPDTHPRVVIKAEEGKYQIIVGAMPQRGHTLSHAPKTLSQQLNG